MSYVTKKQLRAERDGWREDAIQSEREYDALSTKLAELMSANAKAHLRIEQLEEYIRGTALADIMVADGKHEVVFVEQETPGIPDLTTHRVSTKPLSNTGIHYDYMDFPPGPDQNIAPESLDVSK